MFNHSPLQFLAQTPKNCGGHRSQTPVQGTCSLPRYTGALIVSSEARQHSAVDSIEEQLKMEISEASRGTRDRSTARKPHPLRSGNDHRQHRLGCSSRKGRHRIYP